MTPPTGRAFLPRNARLAALGCGLLYLPAGLVWAYGLALLALPLAGLGFWLLRRADRLEQAGGETTTPAQVRLRATARWILFAGLAASAVSLAATR